MDKGEYRARVQIRHESENLLERFRDLPLVIQFKLATPINIDCYPSLNAAYAIDGKKYINTPMPTATRAIVYTTAITDDKY